MSWDKVEGALIAAKGAAFDGCHKIYVLMDDGQMEEQRALGYGTDELPDESFLVTFDATMSVAERLDLIKDWYESSCPLSFVTAVATNLDDPNAGYERLISQGEEV